MCVMAEIVENGSIAKVARQEEDAGAAFVLESKGTSLAFFNGHSSIFV